MKRVLDISCQTIWMYQKQPNLTLQNDWGGKFYVICIFSSVQSLSPVWLFATPWTAACQASLSIANFQSLLKLMFTELVMPSNHLILCRPLLLLPSIFPSIRVFSNEPVFHIRWPKYWSFSFSISPSNEYSGLISFTVDWLDLLAVQETLKSLLQHHSPKASILWHSAFFIVQLSHPYMTTGKTIALTRWTFVGKVMSLLFNMLSRTSLVAQMVERLSIMWETWVRSLGREDPLKKEMAAHSSTLAWKIPWAEEPGGLQSMGSQRVGHDWATPLSF